MRRVRYLASSESQWPASSACSVTSGPTRQISYAGLVEKLAAIGVKDSEANLRNKISRGGFTGAFLIQCLTAMGATTLRLDE